MWLLLLLLFSASFVACISTDDQDVHHFKQQQPQQSSEFSGWRTYAGGIFEAVRAGKMSMLFVLDGTLWSQRLVRDFEGKAKKNEISERLLQSFVFIKAHEQELPPELLIEINQLAPYFPCVFFLNPEGAIIKEIVNEFAPKTQDPIYKYFYKTATPLLKVMNKAVQLHGRHYVDEL